MKQYFPQGLAVGLAILMVWSVINPAMYDVWIAEMIPVVAIYLLLVLTYPKFQFSHTSYALMSVWLILHTIGAHYTFANVPFEWFTQWWGGERNHFDRIAHFSVGFYAYPMVELLLRKKWAVPVTAGLFGLFMIMSVAAGYEIIEWWYADLAGGDAGIEFLGSQGDIWDAQKDMLADTLGAIVALLLYFWKRPDRRP